MSKLKNTALEVVPLESGLRADPQKGVLEGAQVAMLGEAKGHGMMLDSTTLDQIVELGNADPKGVKVRFGHPSMCSPGLGTVIGTRTNFRRDGQFVRADLNITSAANREYARHIFAMAKEHPEKIGNSIVFSGTKEYQVDDNGNRLQDENGEDLLPLVRVDALHAVDVVDEPASGDGMFGEALDGVELSSRTMVELRRELQKPGFAERVLSLLDWRRDGPDAVDAGSESSEKEDAMSLTLEDFEAKHPEVAKQFSAKLSANHAEELAAAESKGREDARSHILRFLGKCGPENFQPEKDMPKGYAFHVIEKDIAFDVALEGLFDRKAKMVELAALESASQSIDVTSAETPGEELSEKQARQSKLVSAAKRLNGKGCE